MSFIGFLPGLKLLLRPDCLKEIAEEDEIESYFTEEKDEAKSLSEEFLRTLKSVGKSHYHRANFNQTNKGN